MKFYSTYLLLILSFSLTGCAGDSKSKDGANTDSSTPGNNEVHMLDSISESGVIYLTAFNPSYIKINLGESVKFTSIDSGHNSQTSLVPDGADTWVTAVSSLSEIITPTKEGVYIYYCGPHESVGMYGIIQVGSGPAINKEEALAKVSTISSRLPTNQAQRLSAAMQEVE